MMLNIVKQKIVENKNQPRLTPFAREAATQSTRLQTLMTQFGTTTTREGQLALLDQILDAWADTSEVKQSYAANDEVNFRATKRESTLGYDEWRAVA